MLIFFLLLIPIKSVAADGQGYPGGGWINLQGPKPPVPGAKTYSEFWTTQSKHLIVSNSLVKISSYFTGLEYVECSYWYTYTDVNGKESKAQGVQYYSIECWEVYLNGIPNSLTMQVGDVETIKWSYNPNNIDTPKLEWSSSNYNVVDVNSSGRIEAKGNGTAVITVKSNVCPTKYINVTVSGGTGIVYVSSISLSESNSTLNVGNTKQLTATVLPTNATDKSVTWSSNNSSVASVSSSGLVTAKAVGTTTIACQANDGSGKSATCSITVKSSTVDPLSIVLPNYTENIKVGETITLTPTIAPSNATTTLTWESSNTAVATVTQNGVVKGLKVGESKITVTTHNGKSAYCYVKVADNVIYVTSISLNATSVTLTEGNTKQLEATVSPSNATNKTVTWSSGNTSVATVSSSGLVTAKSAGSATITCKAVDGSEKQATCSVTVKSSTVEPTGITISPSSKTITVGETFYASYTLTPSNATTTVTWSSDNTSIATVTQTGQVKGVGEGYTYIHVKTANGKTAWFKITVNAATVYVTSISLNTTSASLNVGETKQLSATVSPSNATNKDVTWNSSNTNVATVSSSGLVTAKSAGSATITCKAVDGSEKQATCSVTVKSSTVEPTGITISPSSKTITVGETFYASYTLTPSNATTTVTWSSDNTSIATVTQTGQVKGVGEGYTYIHVKTANGKTAWFKITVNAATVYVTSISLNTTSASLNVGETKQLSATVSPSNATNKDVTWNSSNTNVATVSSSGLVTAKSTGSATITCKANDGSGVTATCSLKVEGELPEPEKGSVKQVVAGWKSFWVLMEDGTLWACGLNEYGKLGDGTTNNFSKFKLIMSGVEFVSAGYNHTMILKEDGTLWACGQNNHGQLGDGSKTDRSTPKQIMTDVASVAAGGWHTLILKSDGTLWACGYNNNGQLGDRTTTDRSSPKKMTDGVAKISAGITHTLFIKTDGTLWGVGSDDFGALAQASILSSTTYITYPKQLMAGAADVAAGSNYTEILKVDGTLWACGDGGYGGLGTGSTATYNWTPKQVTSNVSKVSVFLDHTMILKKDGSLWACGNNYTGQLGDGTTTNRSTPVQVMTEVSDVSAGGYNTIIVKKDGTIWTCGGNQYGQLGDGTKTDRHTPVNIELDILVSSVTLNKTTLSMQASQEEVLEATVKPDNAKDKTVTWTSSNTSVATVDSNGKVTAISSGSATITCTANDGSGKKATCTVTVTVPVNSITLNKTTLSLQTGEQVSLTATVAPNNATDKSVTWSSSYSSVATVSNNGTVTAVAAGNAVITCLANDGSGVTATCEVTVTDPEPIGITISPTSKTIEQGETFTATYTLTPSNATTTVTWSSDNESIATVTQDGIVTGVGVGSTFINVETANGKSAYCKLTVTAPQPTAIALPKNVTVYVGGTLTLTPTLTPEGAETTLTWYSDDQSVVRVSADGVLTGVAEGLALVTVTSSNGITSNACKVKVEPDPSGISNVLIDENSVKPIYTLSGQRLAAPKKGINIIGGKKVVVK